MRNNGQLRQHEPSENHDFNWIVLAILLTDFAQIVSERSLFDMPFPTRIITHANNFV